MRESLNASLRRLTPRETDILPLLLDGKSSNLIARQPGLSPRTVETHRANVPQKMHVESATAPAKLMSRQQTTISPP